MRPLAWYRRVDWWRLAPVLVALLFAVVYLIWQPRTVDLAAHTFRAELFGEEGFTIWNGQWYGGHHTPAYSIISPPIAWLLGPPRGAGAGGGGLRPRSSSRSPAATSARSARAGGRSGSAWPPPPCSSRAGCRSPSAWPSGWRRCSRCSAAATRWRSSSRCLCPLGSPVAGLFLAMAGVAFALAARRRPHEAARGHRDRGRPRSSRPCSSPGPSPRAAGRPSRSRPTCRSRCSRSSAWWCCPAARARSAGAPRSTARGATLALFLDTQMGGNAVRLGALFGGPGAALRDLGAAAGRGGPGRCRCSPPASRRSRSGSGRPPCAT